MARFLQPAQRGGSSSCGVARYLKPADLGVFCDPGHGGVVGVLNLALEDEEKGKKI